MAATPMAGSPSSARPDDGLPPKQRRLAQLAVACAIALSALSITSFSVALPLMARDLGLPPATAVWLVGGFQLALVATLFPFSALGEQWGYARMFHIGLLTIAVASVICAVSTSFAWLLAARVLQGLGTSAVMAMNPALLRLSSPADALGRVLGINAMVVGLSTALGPTLAALVLTAADWRWLFALNLPWAVLAMAIGAHALPRERQGTDRRLDAVGTVLNMATFVCAAAAFDRIASASLWAAPLACSAAACAWGLYAHQRHRPAPLFPLDLLRIPQVGSCVGASVFAFASQMVALVSLPFLLHDVFHLDMLALGMTMMASPLAVAAMAPLAGWKIDGRVPSATLCSLGGAVQCAALLLLACTSAATSHTFMLSLMVLSGVGFGLFQTPNNRAMLGATPRERSGSAGGMQATARLTGQMLGATVVGMAFRFLPGDAASACTLSLLCGALFAAVSAAFSIGRRAVQSAR